MLIEDNEILQGFIEESLEHLADIEQDLLSIEQAGANIDDQLVNKVFRAAHSIKGGAGFMGLAVIQELAHASENILGMIRGRKLIPTPDIVNVLLQASDALQKLIEDIQNSNGVDISHLVSALNAIGEQAAAAVSPSPAPAPVAPPAPPHLEPAPQQDNDGEQALGWGAMEDIALHPETVIPVIEPVVVEHDAEPVVQAAPQPTATDAQSQKMDTSIRVSVNLLDQLMNLAGELVLARNQLLQTINSGDFRNAEAAGGRVDMVTSELQEAIMLTRMQPIGIVFNKFPRVVRDLSKKLYKQVELVIIGKDVEMDKTIIEAINDPLTHLVRNAVDHGIEDPVERKRQGKPAVGQVVLKAFHEAGQVAIQITDDGKGMDGQALAASAVNKGLLSAAQAKAMSDKERLGIIFLPGFSTAKEVTDVSGRGVGMDVVKTNLDKLGGSVEIDSVVGQGSTINIKLPLTLAIIPCQIIMTAGERYAIPQVNLEELLRIPAVQVKERIERVGDAEVVRLRGNLLPLIRLADVLGIQRTFIDPAAKTFRDDRRENIADRRSRFSPLEEAEGSMAPIPADQHVRSDGDRRFRASSALNIVVVSTGAMKYGLIVDRLQDSEEIVIKPLGRHLQHCKGYAGATIMGDGRIALILDVSNLAQMAGLTSMEGSTRAAELADANREAIQAMKDRQALLIFRSAMAEQFAVPLNQVERIEKIKAGAVEQVGGRRVMQYRGGSLPLLRIDDAAAVGPLAEQDDLLVFVFKLAGRDIGLLGIGPVDAIETSAAIDDITLKQTGIMGSAIINGQTTMLVNIFELTRSVQPEWFAEKEQQAVVTTLEGRSSKILIVEDSNFFRNQVRAYLTEVGYHILEAEDGVKALQVLEQHGDEIVLVVTDIEMPNMNGFQMTEQIRANKRHIALPIIALTTLAGEEDIARGKAVGINEYHIKLDKERLMNTVHEYMRRVV